VFHETEKAAWEKWVNVNLYGLMNLARAAIPQMTQQKGGRILTIGSDAGRIGEPRLAVYSGAKAGTFGFIKALAKETARWGITANAVVSSGMDDTFLSQMGRSADTPEARERRQAVMRAYPLARARGALGTTQDMANAVAFMVSDRASWITGQLLSVNGGYCMVD
jgi:3-oxoacyl-[acyl-carrier protein] reductase